MGNPVTVTPFLPHPEGGNYFSVFMRRDYLVQNFPFHCRINISEKVDSALLDFYFLLPSCHKERHTTRDINFFLATCIFLNKMEGGTKLRTMPARIRLPLSPLPSFLHSSFGTPLSLRDGRVFGWDRVGFPVGNKRLGARGKIQHELASAHRESSRPDSKVMTA